MVLAARPGRRGARPRRRSRSVSVRDQLALDAAPDGVADGAVGRELLVLGAGRPDGSGNDQCRRRSPPGKRGHVSLASSQTVMT